MQHMCSVRATSRLRAREIPFSRLLSLGLAAERASTARHQLQEQPLYQTPLSETGSAGRGGNSSCCPHLCRILSAGLCHQGARDGARILLAAVK